MLRLLMFGIAFAILGAAACARGSADTVPSGESPEEEVNPPTDSSRLSGAAAPLVGDWFLRSAPPQRRPGLQLTITVDSAFGAQFFGRLTHYFSGDVGGDPGEYEAFADTIRHGTVRFQLPAVDRDMLGMMFQGAVGTDTIVLEIFVLGPDTLSAGNHSWLLVRQP